ncbi:MAG: DUF6776 family protein [Thiothrix sp.]
MSLEYRFENRGTVQVRPTGSDKRSPCWYILIATVLLLLALLAWQFFSGYLTTADSTGVQALTLRGKMDEQEKLIAKQANTISELEGQLATARRDKEVQVVANEELTRKVAAVEADLAVQRDKLALYEEILSPEGLEPGVHIQHFGVKERLVDNDGKKLNGQHLLRYHLVLANIRNGDTSVKGTFSIVIRGKQGGKIVSVPHKDVTPAGETAVTTFDVKHYQSLEGNLLFPKDFVPETVAVKVTLASGETPERLSKSYDWSSFNTLNR